MSWWDEVIRRIKEGDEFLTPGRGLEGRNSSPFKIHRVSWNEIMVLSGRSIIPLEKVCFDVLEKAFNDEPELKLRVASVRATEPLEGSADKLIREATGSNLARANYVCAILEKYGFVTYVMDGNVKCIGLLNKGLKVSKIPFPNVPIAQRGAYRTFTAPGMFFYRHIQADSLLNIPKLDKEDIPPQDYHQVYDALLSFLFPLKALVIFLNVVALEDFMRDLGDRLADVEGLDAYFPKIKDLKISLKKPQKNKPHGRLDKDPVSYTDFEEINKLYFDCFGIEPFSTNDFPRLNDLVLIRHMVAHHGSIIREIDVPRFKYYSVNPRQIINPPIDFVKETCSFLYSTGQKFERTIRDRVFSEILPKLDKTWMTSPPKLLIDLIEVFDYFGETIFSTDQVPTNKNISFDNVFEIIKEESEIIRRQLIALCIEKLKRDYGRE
ncbi:hypothetical protein [Thermodesulfovibrio sp.]|uniref:hypothetical protein n=1 Tax=Thermodesulfovibrio sp. TaxID=2067987 RepID=UPI00309EB809